GGGPVTDRARTAGGRSARRGRAARGRRGVTARGPVTSGVQDVRRGPSGGCPPHGGDLGQNRHRAPSPSSRTVRRPLSPPASDHPSTGQQQLGDPRTSEEPRAPRRPSSPSPSPRAAATTLPRARRSAPPPPSR